MSCAIVPELPPIKDELLGIHSGGRPLLCRVSRLKWLGEFLEQGKIRLAPASFYQEIENDGARHDDEGTRHLRIPSELITITTEDGTRLEAKGDIVRTRRRSHPWEQPRPYWLASFSTEPDTRLIKDFQSPSADDGLILIQDMDTFLQRFVTGLGQARYFFDKSLEQIEYFDEYHPTKRDFDVHNTKDIRFAYQREFRLCLNPHATPEEPLKPKFFQIGSIEDIAGIYDAAGMKLAGTGPACLWK